MGAPRTRYYVVAVVVGVVLSAAILCSAGISSTYVRNVEKSADMPLDSDVFRVPPGYNAPQQVHITQGDVVGKAMIVSWVTVDEPGSNTVLYWSDNSKHKKEAKGKMKTYKYFTYTSGYIHHCTIRDLQYNTKYYYEVGIGNTTRTFSFITPPEVGPDVPYTFGLIGDLGQSFDSNRTLTHYERNPRKGQTVLFVGDLSYADTYTNHDNVRWDTWGRFVERSAAYQPWIWTAGNHEIDFDPDLGETKPFKPFTNRFRVPYKASNSTAPLCYDYHYMEGETMRVMYEEWFVENKVDIVFAGHVHAYERSERISNVAYNVVNGKCTPVRNQSAPIYITIGDGGNHEGLATIMTEPQPEYSAFREASFGHATLEIKNRTHAYYSWHRNQDGYAVEADSMWVSNRVWHPVDDSTTTIL
nr:purple acid phosphatase 2-like [Ipomoea batatas]